MRNTILVERLLSMFTSADCAAAIAGDLAEEGHRRGSIWFWLHVTGTLLALWRGSLARGPMVVLGVVMGGCALLAVAGFVGIATVFLFPPSIGSPMHWATLSLCWWGGAFGTGAALVGIAPRCGMAACALLAVAGEALLVAFVVQKVGELEGRPPSAQLVLFASTGLIAAVPFLLGGAIARRRLIGWGIPAMEEQQ